MRELPQALSGLAEYRQFVLFKIVPDTPKNRKIPLNPHTKEKFEKNSGWQKRPELWTGAAEACAAAEQLGPEYGVGFLLTREDPFFFVDLDHVLTPGGQWTTLANEICTKLRGCAVEISNGQDGLHIIGRGQVPVHGCEYRPEPSEGTTQNVDFYTSGRFIALTGTSAQGNVNAEMTGPINELVQRYWPPKATDWTDWTDYPVSGVEPITEDSDLIAKALETTGIRSAFGQSAPFRALWENDEQVLGQYWPHKSEPYNRSDADMALAQRLAWWTGSNCERIRHLMLQSALVRPKWDTEGYLVNTIKNACGMQTSWYGEKKPPTIAGLPAIQGNSAGQVNYATSVRDTIIAAATEEQRGILEAETGAEFWLNVKDKTPAEIVDALTPLENAFDPFGNDLHEPEIMTSYPLLTPDQQVQYFAGCMYVQELNRVLTPWGGLLAKEQFNGTYSNYYFSNSLTKDVKTKSAWEAFTQSLVVRYPKAHGVVFRPDLEPLKRTKVEGLWYVNSYTPCVTERRQGDPGPFLEHVRKLVPDDNDRNILLGYMAACVQMRGVKFQWAPLIQGTEGNGKTLLTRCVAYAVGKRHCHFPKAADIDNKFNSWLMGNIFIGVEDIYVPAHRREVIETLKPYITGGDGLEIQYKGVDQINADICCNFMLNSNHHDGIVKTRNDRRFCVFFTAQQSVEDVARDGMDGSYFPRLYSWLKAEGFSIVNEFLHTYNLTPEFKDLLLSRAPDTSTTHHAIEASRGNLEQFILEAVAEGRMGFNNGWISSFWLDDLISRSRHSLAINKRKEILRDLGYDPHPHLREGRTNNAIACDGNRKSRLYIKRGSDLANITEPPMIVQRYISDQGQAIDHGDSKGAAVC